MGRGITDTGVCNCIVGTPHVVDGNCTCENNPVISNVPQPPKQPPVIVFNNPHSLIPIPTLTRDGLMTWYAANKKTALVIAGVAAAYFLFFKKN